MKLILACMAFWVCTAEGMRRSALLKQREQLLAELSAMLCGFAIEIRCTAPTLSELCSAATGVFANLLRECKDGSRDIREAWENACGRLSALPCSGREETALLRELGASLGKSDAQGQLALIELYRERLAQCEKQASQELLQKGRLYRSLGVLCGLGAAVMVL